MNLGWIISDVERRYGLKAAVADSDLSALGDLQAGLVDYVLVDVPGGIEVTAIDRIGNATEEGSAIFRLLHEKCGPASGLVIKIMTVGYALQCLVIMRTSGPGAERIDWARQVMLDERAVKPRGWAM